METRRDPLFLSECREPTYLNRLEPEDEPHTRVLGKRLNLDPNPWLLVLWR